MMARKTPKNRRRVRKNKSFKRQRGGDKRDVDHSTPNTPGFLHAHDPDGNIMVTADPVVDSQPVDPNAVVVEAKPVESDEQQKAQMKALQAAEEKAQPEFDDKPTSFAENILGDSGDSGDNLKKIFSNKYLEQNGGFGGHSVDSHDVSLFEEWKNKIKENFTDLEIMRALIETSNKSVEDAYDWLKKAKKENDPRLKRPLPEPLGRPTGPYMLYTPASTDQYGWPYNLQQDGRYSTSTSSSNCNETKKDGGASYSDATVFGANINLKREMGLRTSNNKPKQKTSPASDTKAPPASDTKAPMKGGAKEDSKELPADNFIDGIYNFLSGGWIKLFTKGAPDIFGWVQQRSWIFHRWLMYTMLKTVGTFFGDDLKGMTWWVVAALITFAPLLMSTAFPTIIAIISYFYTFFQYYLYGLAKDNHLLTGWTWAGNFLFLPPLLGLVTGWIPILNIITVPIALLLSLLPSVQTYVVPGVTSILQTLRTCLFLCFGHILTPTGWKFYKDSITNPDRYRGLFILELCLVLALVIYNYFPAGESVRTGWVGGVAIGWLIQQIYFWKMGKSGWGGWMKEKTKDK